MASLPVVLAMVLSASCFSSPDSADLDVSNVNADAYHMIASQIFQNETGANIQYLTYWGDGEDFPSFGIGHFIWFPSGVDAPFDETFPDLLSFLAEQTDACAPPPDWVRDLDKVDAPWNDKAQFDSEQQSDHMRSLRQWLAQTAPEQAQFIVARFGERWHRLGGIPTGEKAHLTRVLSDLMDTPRGLVAVIDYLNFKGFGTNPRERYNGQGWGLIQVLTDIVDAQAEDSEANLVGLFSRAAADRLRLRVANAPADRQESRWLPGWLKRVSAYADAAPRAAMRARGQFRVTPYLQSTTDSSATLVWFSEQAMSARVTLRTDDMQAADDDRVVTSIPKQACELSYHLAEYKDLGIAYPAPYKHRVTLDGLTPSQNYRYEVVQGGEVASSSFKLPALGDLPLSFVVYADSETEPESTGKHSLWPAPGNDSEKRLYVVDQTDGYAANLEVIRNGEPDFVAIAGDLVESGGEQRDWDEFWRHNAELASTVPIVPALGNHEYYGGPGDLGGYSNAASQRATDKYRTYFDRPPWYVINYGPIAFIVIDSNNSLPERSSLDTNWLLSGAAEGGVASSWQVGSEQMEWLKQELATAQKTKSFTFVMFHQAPYTSGIHGQSPGIGNAENFASSLPLQSLSKLFLRFGVGAVFNGHDEMYEHSSVAGLEQRPDGISSPHKVHFLTVGIGGDGLRGPADNVTNPESLFIAHRDSPEVYDDNGILLDGGKHYGHAAVEVTRKDNGNWQARVEPVYVFPITSSEGEVIEFERRIYDDVLILEAASGY